MPAKKARQLSFDVGGSHLVPLSGLFKMSGGVASDKEVDKGADVKVTVTDLGTGEVIASGTGYVQAVTFKEHRPSEEPDWTERIHSIKIEDPGA